MTWIADVAPYTTIQSAWGNNVRNRVVQTFADTAERDSHTATLPDGSIAYCVSPDRLYVKRGGTWRPLVTASVKGTCTDNMVATTTGVQVAQIALPAGFAFYICQYVVPVRTVVAGQASHVQISVNGASPIWTSTTTIRDFGSISALCAFQPNPAGETLTVFASLATSNPGVLDVAFQGGTIAATMFPGG